MNEFLSDREIEEKVLSLVSWARQHYEIPLGSTGKKACSKIGLSLRRGRLPRGTDGCLVEADGTVIINEQIVWQSRIEFTIFHELLHHLLNEDGEIIEYYTDKLANDSAAYDRAIERWCHAGAAEFLMPRQKVIETINTVGFSIETIEHLANRHGASILASAIQLAICAPVDCYVAVCSYGTSPYYWPPVQTLYVDQASHRPGMKYPWARYAPIPSDHLFYQAWRTQERLEGSSFIEFPKSGIRMSCKHGEAKPLGNRIVGILYRGHPPRKSHTAFNLPLF